MAEKTPIKEQIKVLTEQIETGIQALFQSGDLEKYQAYLRTASRFHRYSVNNQMLIFSQCPHATLVAGYQKWQNQFSRHVLRGEKGITIIAPTPYKIKVEQDKLDPDTKQPLLDADGKTITEEKEVQIPMFRPVKVFDVSQTDGKPLPEQVKSPIAELTGNVEHYEAFMDALKRVSPVPIEMKPLTNDLDGFFSPSKQSITLREGMSEVQTVCAAVHEIAHSKLHNYAMQPDSQPKDSSTEEIEAESIAYTVCAYFGIETSANSFGYVATWSKNAELPEFRASLDTISKTANGIITDVEKHFAEVCKERGIELPKDTEYELVTILPSRADALAFAAEYAAFLRRDLNVPDSADRLTAEAVADRLLAGEDTELRKELEDFVKLADEIGIDDGSHGLLERFNALFRREWRAKEGPQPEVKAEMDEKMTELPPLPEEPPMMEEPGERVFDIPEGLDREEVKAAPAKQPAPASAAPAAQPVQAVNGNWWRALAEGCKGRLPPMYRVFLDMCTGVLEGGLLTVYAPDDITLGRLDNDRVRNALMEEAASGGVTVRLVFQVGEPPKATPRENLQNLLKFGSQFDNIEIK